MSCHILLRYYFTLFSEKKLAQDGLRTAYSKGELKLSSLCWAAGMPEWAPLKDVRELRWAVARGTPFLTPVQVSSSAFLEHSFSGS